MQMSVSPGHTHLSLYFCDRDWPSELKIFIIWSFTEKVCRALLSCQRRKWCCQRGNWDPEGWDEFSKAPCFWGTPPLLNYLNNVSDALQETEVRLLGTSLVVQWVRLHAPNAGVPGLIPGRELDPACMPQLRVCMPQLKDPAFCNEDPACCN